VNWFEVFDVLASNELAGALSPNLVAGRNRLRDIFLDPTEQELYVEWSRSVSTMVGGFRASVGTLGDDPAVIKLVGELSLESDREKLQIAGTDGMLLAVYHAAPGSETEGLLRLIGSMAATVAAQASGPSTSAPSQRSPTSTS